MVPVVVLVASAQALDAAVEVVARKMVNWRRDIHADPELSGHDAHTGVLMGAAEVLAAREKRGRPEGAQGVVKMLRATASPTLMPSTPAERMPPA